MNNKEHSMIAKIVGYVAGTAAFVSMCNWVGLDWQLMLALAHDVSRGNFYFPEIQLPKIG